MLHTYKLDTGATMVLCHEHADLAGDQVVADEGRTAGARWSCRVCTIHRRLIGELTDPVSVLCGDYVITRFPTGVTYCTCHSWLFKKLPVGERWCKHTVAAAGQLDEAIANRNRLR